MRRSFAMVLGEEMVKSGFSPSLHHAEKIKGENRELVVKETGVYRFDDLILLKQAKIPAVLIECGIIKNRDQELLLRDPAYRKKTVAAIVSAIKKYAYKSRLAVRAP